MDDAKWQDLVNRWLDGQLSETEYVEFQQHIEENPRRRSEAQDLKDLLMMLHDIPEVDVPEGFRTSLMNKIQSMEDTPKLKTVTPRKSSSSFRYSSALALAAAVLVVFVSLTSVLPRVLPGFRLWYNNGIQSESNDDTRQPGIAGLDDPEKKCGDDNGLPLYAGEAKYMDYDDMEAVGLGKMDSFPRLGPYRSEIEFSADIVVNQKLEIPYFWASILVDELEVSLDELLVYAVERGGVTSQVEVFRVSGEDVRANVTIYIPSPGFDELVSEVISAGTVQEQEKLMVDRSTEYAALLQMIQEEKSDIQHLEAVLETQENEAEKEQLMMDLEIRRGSLSVLEQAKSTQLCGILEFSMIVKR